MPHTPGHPSTNLDAPGKTVTVRIETEPSYSSEAPDDWRVIREMTKSQYGFGSVADVGARVRMGASRFRGVNRRWPTALELWADPSYQRSIQTLASGSVGLPIRFRTDDGRVWFNDPISGLKQQTGDLVDKLSFGLRGQPDLPTIPLADMPSIMAALSPIRPPSAGRGRGRGAGRAPIVFDQAELVEGARERWRGLLLEEPDDTELSRLVGDYIDDATAFWMKEGGRRDFDTFVVDRIRTNPRHDFLYSRKPGFQSEGEYLTGFRNVVANTGINQTAALREIEAGASSGAGLGGFAERVGRTREARLTSNNQFGSRLAQSMATSGLGRT